MFSFTFFVHIDAYPPVDIMLLVHKSGNSIFPFKCIYSSPSNHHLSHSIRTIIIIYYTQSYKTSSVLLQLTFV